MPHAVTTIEPSLPPILGPIIDIGLPILADIFGPQPPRGLPAFTPTPPTPIFPSPVVPLDPHAPTRFSVGRAFAPGPVPSAPPARVPAPATGPANIINALLQLLAPLLSELAACRRKTAQVIQRGGNQMPFSISPGFGGTPGGLDFGGFGGIAQSLIQAAGQIVPAILGGGTRTTELRPAVAPQFGTSPFQQASLVPFASKLPGLVKQIPGILGGAAGGLAAEGLFGFFGGADDLDVTAAFTDPIPGKCRPKAHVKNNPCTGKGVWFVPRGRPLVFSGDLSAAKRLDRVAKTLDKARPKRRHHHHPR